ncbi:hypothetical protein MMC26_002072 [Xylographa opegraphella]|nr:hypothetical protein [Xylographa opegraphella]
MISSAIEALYIFNQHNDSILEHVYRSRPAPARTVLLPYLAHAAPRPSVIYLPNTNPQTTLFSLVQPNVLFLVPASSDTEPLFVLEFLHRLVDVLEDFLGAPLLASKIEGNYDVVAQLLGEMCDAGSVCNTEPNALRDVVDVPRWVDKLLGGVGLPGSSPAILPSGGLRPPLTNPATSGPAIPWRRANVRYTSNELYVDIIETLSVTLAPSGRPLAAFANGSIAFTSKISGVPDLLLTLSVPGGKQAVDKVFELPVFHPCVRLARWRENPGELSFVPPDGKFMLAGYEVNLLPSTSLISRTIKNLNLPATIEVLTSLGPTGSDFEVRLLISSLFTASSSSSSSSSRPGPASRGSGKSTPFFGGGGSSAAPLLQDVVITIPMPEMVRNITDLRASRGEAQFTPTDNLVEWRISTKAASIAGNATLRCTVVGPLSEEDEENMGNGFRFDAANGEYDEKEDAYQSSTTEPPRPEITKEQQEQKDARKVQMNAPLMPSSASASFSVKGWLASGIKVESLNLDLRKSRGLGEGVKPVKGVKYLTISKKGVETRC